MYICIYIYICMYIYMYIYRVFKIKKTSLSSFYLISPKLTTLDRLKLTSNAQAMSIIFAP